MSIFSKLKPQKIVDAVFSGVDKSVLTKEEIVDYAKESAKINQEFVRMTMAESSPRSITRRVIAVLVLGQYFIAFNVGLVGIVSGWYDGKEILSLATDAFEWASISVIIFYFGNHLLTNVTQKFADAKKPKP